VGYEMTILKEAGNEKVEDITWKDANVILKSMKKIQCIVLNYEGPCDFQIRLSDVELQPGGNFVRFGATTGTLSLNRGRKYKVTKKDGVPSGIAVDCDNHFSFYIHL